MLGFEPIAYEATATHNGPIQPVRVYNIPPQLGGKTSPVQLKGGVIQSAQQLAHPSS